MLIAGRRPDKLDTVSGELGQTEAGRVAYSADVRSARELARLGTAVEADHGPVHVLVNCQGTSAIKPALDIT